MFAWLGGGGGDDDDEEAERAPWVAPRVARDDFDIDARRRTPSAASAGRVALNSEAAFREAFSVPVGERFVHSCECQLRTPEDWLVRGSLFLSARRVCFRGVANVAAAPNAAHTFLSDVVAVHADEAANSIRLSSKTIGAALFEFAAASNYVATLTALEDLWRQRHLTAPVTRARGPAPPALPSPRAHSARSEASSDEEAAAVALSPVAPRARAADAPPRKPPPTWFEACFVAYAWIGRQEEEALMRARARRRAPPPPREKCT